MKEIIISDSNLIIRNENISKVIYDVPCIKRTLIHPKITSEYTEILGNDPIYHNTNYGSLQLKLDFYVKSESRERTENQISELIYALSDKFKLSFQTNNSNGTWALNTNDEEIYIDYGDIEDNGYSYKCIYESNDISEHITPTNKIISLAFNVSRMWRTENISLKDNTEYSFNIRGTKAIDPVITITPLNDMESFIYDDITIYNLTANQPVIIDCENKEITENGVNKFLDTDIIDFPKYKSGNNSINVSSSDVTIQLTYNPTYI